MISFFDAFRLRHDALMSLISPLSLLSSISYCLRPLPLWARWVHYASIFRCPLWLIFFRWLLIFWWLFSFTFLIFFDFCQFRHWCFRSAIIISFDAASLLFIDYIDIIVWCCHYFHAMIFLMPCHDMLYALMMLMIFFRRFSSMLIAAAFAITRRLWCFRRLCWCCWWYCCLIFSLICCWLLFCCHAYAFDSWLIAFAYAFFFCLIFCRQLSIFSLRFLLMLQASFLIFHFFFYAICYFRYFRYLMLLSCCWLYIAIFIIFTLMLRHFRLLMLIMPQMPADYFISLMPFSLFCRWYCWLLPCRWCWCRCHFRHLFSFRFLSMPLDDCCMLITLSPFSLFRHFRSALIDIFIIMLSLMLIFAFRWFSLFRHVIAFFLDWCFLPRFLSLLFLPLSMLPRRMPLLLFALIFAFIDIFADHFHYFHWCHALQLFMLRRRLLFSLMRRWWCWYFAADIFFERHNAAALIFDAIYYILHYFHISFTAFDFPFLIYFLIFFWCFFLSDAFMLLLMLFIYAIFFIIYDIFIFLSAMLDAAASSSSMLPLLIRWYFAIIYAFRCFRFRLCCWCCFRLMLISLAPLIFSLLITPPLLFSLLIFAADCLIAMLSPLRWCQRAMLPLMLSDFRRHFRHFRWLRFMSLMMPFWYYFILYDIDCRLIFAAAAAAFFLIKMLIDAADAIVFLSFTQPCRWCHCWCMMSLIFFFSLAADAFFDFADALFIFAFRHFAILMAAFFLRLFRSMLPLWLLFRHFHYCCHAICLFMPLFSCYWCFLRRPLIISPLPFRHILRFLSCHAADFLSPLFWYYQLIDICLLFIIFAIIFRWCQLWLFIFAFAIIADYFCWLFSLLPIFIDCHADIYFDAISSPPWLFRCWWYEWLIISISRYADAYAIILLMLALFAAYHQHILMPCFFALFICATCLLLLLLIAAVIVVSPPCRWCHTIVDILMPCFIFIIYFFRCWFSFMIISFSYYCHYWCWFSAMIFAGLAMLMIAYADDFRFRCAIAIAMIFSFYWLFIMLMLIWYWLPLLYFLRFIFSLRRCFRHFRWLMLPLIMLLLLLDAYFRYYTRCAMFIRWRSYAYADIIVTCWWCYCAITLIDFIFFIFSYLPDDYCCWYYFIFAIFFIDADYYYAIIFIILIIAVPMPFSLYLLLFFDADDDDYYWLRHADIFIAALYFHYAFHIFADWWYYYMIHIRWYYIYDIH